jgi:hypothetical protein
LFSKADTLFTRRRPLACAATGVSPPPAPPDNEYYLQARPYRAAVAKSAHFAPP